MSTDPSADAATGQVSTTAAEVYEQFFVPALFGQWVEQVLDAVGAAAGTGCSTSVPGRESSLGRRLGA
jgi:hypothetical protein